MVDDELTAHAGQDAFLGYGGGYLFREALHFAEGQQHLEWVIRALRRAHQFGVESLCGFKIRREGGEPYPVIGDELLEALPGADAYLLASFLHLQRKRYIRLDVAPRAGAENGDHKTSCNLTNPTTCCIFIL